LQKSHISQYLIIDEEIGQRSLNGNMIEALQLAREYEYLK
jgi:hypothetical protein